MGLAHDIRKNIGKAIEPIRAGDDKLASRRLGVTDGIRTIEITSSAFTDGGSLPVTFTADGAGIAPPITWSNMPDGARSLVLIAEDPDAPMPNPFVHWLVYGLPVTTGSITTSPDGGREGKNTLLKNGYAPASPPRGHGLHHYHFQIFALDTVLELGEGAGRNALLDAMRNHVIAWGEIVATYERS
jgi:Raf kinase inhibitor-like YbhB/YbcL family protein